MVEVSRSSLSILSLRPPMLPALGLLPSIPTATVTSTVEYLTSIPYLINAPLAAKVSVSILYSITNKCDQLLGILSYSPRFYKSVKQLVKYLLFEIASIKSLELRCLQDFPQYKDLNYPTINAIVQKSLTRWQWRERRGTEVALGYGVYCHGDVVQAGRHVGG